MNRSRWVLRVVVLVAATAAVAAVVYELRAKKQLADQTANEIEDQLDALDPLTRAAVVARLGKDAVRGG